MANDSQEFRVGCIFANEKAHAVEITNGCHVLVTTPNSLSRMLSKHRITSIRSGFWIRVTLIRSWTKKACTAHS